MRRTSLVLLCLLFASPAAAVPPEERTQFVLVSLDTTPSGRRAIEGTDFNRILRATTPPRATRPGSFTVFVATGGLTLDPRTPVSDSVRTHLGTLPRNRPVMRYAENLAHLEARAAAVRRMAELGIEIGSHAVRHEHGREWSRAQWQNEMREHRTISERLGLPQPTGFRAPFLEHNASMYDVLREQGYRYDVSRTGGNRWPARDPESGLWLFTLPSVHVEGFGRPALLFDDNLRRVLTRRAREEGVEAAARTQFMDAAFRRAVRSGFERRYRGNRAPFLISGHGGFITPTVQFLREVCRRPHVRCASFSEAVDYMEAHPELEGATE